MTEHFITVPGNQDNLGSQQFLQFVNERVLIILGILLEDLVRHDYLVAAFDHVTSIQDYVRDDAIEMHVLHD